MEGIPGLVPEAKAVFFKLVHLGGHLFLFGFQGR